MSSCIIENKLDKMTKQIPTKLKQGLESIVKGVSAVSSLAEAFMKDPSNPDVRAGVERIIKDTYRNLVEKNPDNPSLKAFLYGVENTDFIATRDDVVRSYLNNAVKIYKKDLMDKVEENYTTLVDSLDEKVLRELIITSSPPSKSKEKEIKKAHEEYFKSNQIRERIEKGDEKAIQEAYKEIGEWLKYNPFVEAIGYSLRVGGKDMVIQYFLGISMVKLERLLKTLEGKEKTYLKEIVDSADDKIKEQLYTSIALNAIKK